MDDCTRYLKTIEQLREQLSRAEDTIKTIRQERNELKSENVRLRNQIGAMNDDYQAFDMGNVIDQLRQQRELQRQRASQMEEAIYLIQQESVDSWDVLSREYEILIGQIQAVISEPSAEQVATLMYKAFMDTYHIEVNAHQQSIEGLNRTFIPATERNLALISGSFIQAHNRLAGLFAGGVKFLHHILAVSGQPEIICSYILGDLRNSEPIDFDFAHLERIGVDWFIENISESPKKLTTIREWLILSEEIQKSGLSYDAAGGHFGVSRDVVIRAMKFRNQVDMAVKSSPFGI